MTSLAQLRYASPIGPLLLLATERGLVEVVFHAEERVAARALEETTRRLGAAAVDGVDAVDDTERLSPVAAQLDAYFAGGLREFDVQLDWSLTAGFNRRVQQALFERVRFGATASYQNLADWVGEPGAARAVGVAMASNPLPLVVPCHRVVESGGGLGGFGGGLETKRRLLALEGVLPEALF
jgi:methylated-DNA-[protein]-cysteine S-methyltransferase